MTHDRPDSEQDPEATIALPAEHYLAAAEAQIDNYRLLDKLGEGGMGVVYLAEQLQPVQRQVALKIIKLGMDTRQVVERFESERQSLAVMDHPSIAQVFDAGTTRTGRPYFVMELVRGDPLNEYCDRKKLSLAQRLRLVIDICHGVQHAHQKGVIHRDLKPSNILVVEDQGIPLPKIIDFGIAKATGTGAAGKSDCTVAGQFVGTPAYMSPEQWGISGIDVDARTDIYSLGVLLYELLVGAKPFERSVSIVDLHRMVRETIPTRPSLRLATVDTPVAEIAGTRGTDLRTLKRQVRGDLDWIVMMALEKDRDRRYQTANGLALDLQRYLNHEPVRARPPSATYRVAKFVRRNRLGVAMASALLAALLAGVAGTSIGFLRARQQTRRAVATRDFLKNMLSSVRPDRAQGREVTVREVLEEAAISIGNQLEGTPEIQAEIQETIGTVYSALGLYEPAEPHLKRAVELYNGTLGPHDEATLRSLNVLALNYWRHGNLDIAEVTWQRLLDEYLGTLGEEHVETLTAMQNVAALKMKRGELGGVEELLLRVLAGRRKVGETPEKTTATINNLAHLYMDTERPAEAEPLFLEAYEIRRATLGDNHPRTLVSAFNLGDLYLKTGRTMRAEPLLREAATALERVAGADHPDTLEAMASFAQALIEIGRYDEAETTALTNHERTLARYGAEHAMTVAARGRLSRLYELAGRRAESERWKLATPTAE